MKGREAILGEYAGREAAALIVDGVLDDLLIDSDAPSLGTIYRARAVRPVKGQGGMFLDTPDGSAFLRGSKGLSSGDILLVQVSGIAEPGKAIPVTSKILFKSRYSIVTPDAPGTNLSRSIREDEDRIRILSAADTENAAETSHGIILRTQCQAASDDEIADDVDAMLAVCDQVLSDVGTEVEKLLDGDGPHELAWRDWITDAVRHGDLDDHVDVARDTWVRLPAGAGMYIEPTRALVAVDINTGSDTSLAAGLKANIAAMRALPSALRIKGLAGQVVIDTAPSSKKDRKVIESALRAALKADDVETSIVGWTPLGHIELSRKRARAPLATVVGGMST
ncbi:MAG: ribonuclease E/G [Paracoccaceae bacterium]